MVPKKNMKLQKKINFLWLVLVLQELFYIYTDQNLSMDSLLDISSLSLFFTPLKVQNTFQHPIPLKTVWGQKNAYFSLYFLKIMLTFGKFGLHFFLMFISSFHETCGSHPKQLLFAS